MIPTSLKTTREVINKACNTLEQAASLDNNFPDIGDTFTGHSSGEYTIAQGPVEPIITRSNFSPTVDVLEQLLRRKPSSPAGIFPEINRAYFAVDNQLFFWCYNDRQDLTEYNDTHEIISVALVKPKPDIFNHTITHVLIITTTEEIKVVPIAYTCNENLIDSITFYDTGIKTFSDGIRFTNILGTIVGRIFMTGSDGNVWELVYKRDEGWFSKRCFKTILTGDFKSIFFGGIQDPCVSIAISDDGQVLYQLTQKSNIKVSYLGSSGQEFTTITIGTGIGEKARLMCPNNALLNTNNFVISSIHPILPSESRRYQLVAITSTGIRLYFTHFKHDSTFKSGEAPNGIELIHVRTPAPDNTTINPSSQHIGASPTQSSPLSLSISKCLYNNGVFMLVKSHNNTETLTSTCPDIGYLARKGGRSGLHEMCSNQSIKGNIIAIAEISKTSFSVNELVSSTSLDTPRLFLVFTTLGLTVLLKQRPLDMLQNLLMVSGGNIRHRLNAFKDFFEYFGPTQFSSLCFGLIGHADPSFVNEIDLFSNISPSIDVKKGAADLLEEYGDYLASQNSLDSSQHDGLALYIHRVIRSIWTQPIMKEIPSNGAQPQYQSANNRRQLLTIQQALRATQNYMDRKKSIQPDPHSSGELYELYRLIQLLAEAVSFTIYLLDADLNSLLKKFKPAVHAKIKTLTYKTLLTTEDGRIISKNFTEALVDRQRNKYGNADVVMNHLKQHCGYFVAELVDK